MKKSVIFFGIILLVFSLSFSSATLIGDFWNKITGKTISGNNFLEPSAGSCAGSCGGASNNGACWCDDPDDGWGGCESWGDCCSDYYSVCSEGGGTPDPTPNPNPDPDPIPDPEPIPTPTPNPIPDPEPNPQPNPDNTGEDEDEYGSCQNSCGGQSSQGCWCDSLCPIFQDCCPDFNGICSQDPNLCGANSAYAFDPGICPNTYNCEPAEEFCEHLYECVPIGQCENPSPEVWCNGNPKYFGVSVKYGDDVKKNGCNRCAKSGIDFSDAQSVIDKFIVTNNYVGECKIREVCRFAGSNPNSQHELGNAADIYCPKKSGAQDIDKLLTLCHSMLEGTDFRCDIHTNSKDWLGGTCKDPRKSSTYKSGAMYHVHCDTKYSK